MDSEAVATGRHSAGPRPVDRRVDGGATAGRRLNSLTGLRAIAALCVFFDHIRFVALGGPRSILDHIGGQGAMGVTFFFALSGFVLAWGQKLPVRTADFWWGRVARIYPAYVVALIGGVVVTVYAHGAAGMGRPLVACLLLIQSWIPHSSYYFAINGPSWSLSCEMFFYLLFPLAFSWIRPCGLRTRRCVALALLAVMLTVDILAQGLSHDNATWVINALPAVRLPEFLLGVLLALEIRDRTLPRVNLVFASVLAVATYASGGIWLSPYMNTVLPIVPFLLVLAAFAQADLRGQRTLVSRPVMVLLGEISYCFYLVHQLVIRSWDVFGAHSSPVFVLGSAVICLAVSLVAAWLLHRIVELPVNSWLRSLRAGLRPRPAVAAATT